MCMFYKMMVFVIILAFLPVLNGRALTLPAGEPAAVEIENKENDILKEYGFSETGGAIPGYVEERACSAAGCHQKLCKDFENTDKSLSFRLPRKERFIADFNKTYYHEKSQRYYRMIQKGDDLFFTRYQIDHEGKRINQLELKVAYLHGAGTLVRAYIYRTPAGELYQLPLVWYNQLKEWRMGPGFDRDDHIGIRRPVRRECQFCHNGYAQLPVDGDKPWSPHRYPDIMPEGIGCQRCHGPGAKHTRLGLEALRPGNTVTAEALRTSIVNPERLSPQLQDDSCNQCHKRTSKTVHPIYRFGRGTFSYKPGEAIADYMVLVHVEHAGSGLVGRIGAISQPAHTAKSTCYKKSGGSLTCITCHESHRKIPPAERPAHYRKACLKCHGIDNCVETDTRAKIASGNHEVDCAGCHMPKRPSTVAQFPITDHLIERNPAKQTTPPPLTGVPPIVTAARVLEPTGDLGELYRVMSVAASSAEGHDAVNYLKKLIEKLNPQDPEPYYVLANGYARLKRWREAHDELESFTKKYPENVQAKLLYALSFMALGKNGEAQLMMEETLKLDPENPNNLYNSGIVYRSVGKYEEAAHQFQKAVQLRPIFVAAWILLGQMNEKLNKDEQAVECFKRALQLAPEYESAYSAMAKVLIRLRKPAEAKRYILHGIKNVEKPEHLKKLYDAAGLKQL